MRGYDFHEAFYHNSNIHDMWDRGTANSGPNIQIK